MQPKRLKWFMTVLAVLINLGGGPMAWAHLAGAAKCHGEAAVTVQMSPDCPGHHESKSTGDRYAPGPHALSCCADVSCACGAPSSMLASVSFVQSSTIIIESSSAPPTTAAPSTFIDDALRPPIA